MKKRKPYRSKIKTIAGNTKKSNKLVDFKIEMIGITKFCVKHFSDSIFEIESKLKPETWEPFSDIVDEINIVLTDE